MLSRNFGRSLACLAVGVALAVLPQLATAEDQVPLNRGVGRQVANFTLRDVLNDKPINLYGFFGKRAIVLFFSGTDCPVSNLYLPRLEELAKTYRAKGIVFLAINSNAQETTEQVTDHARKHGITFPVLKDVGNVVADVNLVDRTCEVLVVDGRARLRYRGAVDDQYTATTHKDEPTQRYLADALDALLAGNEIKVAATAVAGCPLDRVEPKEVLRPKGPRVRPAAPEIVDALKAREEPVEVGQVTYAADVATIVQAKCQSCHRPGQSAPFSLLNYDQARRWSASILEVVEERRMPPWHADPKYGHFANDRSLSARERATLLAWANQGAPLGDAQKLPPARSFPDGWSIGTPDVVYELPETYTVAAQGVLPYQYFVVPTGFTEDRWIQAAEARPGDRSVVHHIVAFIDDHKPRKDRKRGDGMGAFLVGFAPGDLPSVYEPGTAKLIPAGSDLLIQMHYTPIGQTKTDRSSIALIFAKEPPKHRAVTLGIAQPKFEIPAGAGNYEVTSSYVFPTDSHLLNLMPHMHLRGKDFKYTATFPDGKSEVLLSVPAFDFGWQSVYRLTEPKAMPKGTRIDCVAHFDNSVANPANPDPTQAVRWGEQTFEEMMIGYVDFSEDAAIDLKASAEATKAGASPRTSPPRAPDAGSRDTTEAAAVAR
ncbi:MAG TPA: redoxin domain-containing protein [Isosphaeraceae bacterium]|jgi:peroxiredoxin|nr:redoxin domain-containing protein [Isosphaeraceae bacterium]